MLSDKEKIDILWKKLHGVSQTSSVYQLHAPKNLENEEIVSKNAVLTNNIWTFSKNIPQVPPIYSNSIVEVVQNEVLSKDKTSPRAFSLIRENERMEDWISPALNIKYFVTILHNDVNLTSYDKNYPWYFDYSSGVLYFSDKIPEGTIKIYGYRYVGAKGLGSQELNFNDSKLYEVETPTMNVGDTFDFEAPTGYNIKLIDLWIDDTNVGKDILFKECECIVECHWYSNYNSLNPYIFKAVKSHLQDNGEYYINGQAYSGPKFVDLVNLQDSESGVTYWRIKKINQRGRVNLKFNYINNDTGIPLKNDGFLKHVSDDLSPTLGNSLNTNTYAITCPNENVKLISNGRYYVNIDGNNYPKSVGTSGQVLKSDGNGNIIWGDITETPFSVSISYLYPNGSESLPSSITKNTRIEIDNPYPTNDCIFIAEIKTQDIWGETGVSVYSIDNTIKSYFLKAFQNGNKIIIQSGINGVADSSNVSGNVFNINEAIETSVYRIKVIKLN